MKQKLRLGESYAFTTNKPKQFKIGYISLLTVLTIMCLQAYAQRPEPSGPAPLGIYLDSIKPLKIGDTIPELLWHLPLQVVNHAEGKETMTLNDYRAKELIVLDFWATWCVPCIQSLHKLDKLQKKYKEIVAIIPTTSEKEEKAYRFLKEQNLELGSAVSEASLKDFFPHLSIPYQVWIKNNQVFAIPLPEYVSGEALAKVIRDEPVNLLMNEYVALDKHRPLFIDGNGGDGSEMLYYSTISKRIKPRIGGGGFKNSTNDNKVLFINVSAEYLFYAAFEKEIGMDKRRVVWEVNDSLYRRIKGIGFNKPIGNYAADTAFYNWQSQNLFCYNLFAIGKMDDVPVRNIMKNDLNSHFGVYYGIGAHVERRKVPCLVLRQQGSSSTLESAGGDLLVELNDPDRYRCINAPFETVITQMLSGIEPGRLFVDSTAFGSKRVDISLPTSINGNLMQAQRELFKYGLQLYREEVELDMLVIKKVL